MIPDFSHDIRIRLSRLEKKAETANRAETEQRQDATTIKKISGANLILIL